MPEHRLKPVTAFGATLPREQVFDGVTLKEIPDLAIASLAQRTGGDLSGAEALLGAPLPAPGRAATMTPIDAIWTGPQQWFFLAPHASHETLADTLKAAVGAAGSVTEQSDGWTCFALEGPGVGALLERLSLLDTAQVQTGFAARSVVHHIGCFLICDVPGQRWRILGARSSAQSLFDAIAHVAASLAAVPRSTG